MYTVATDLTYNKHPLNTATTILLNVNEFGYVGLRSFALRNMRYCFLTTVEEDETQDEVIDRLASACWTGCDYFRMWLGDEYINYKIHETKENINLKDLSNGVYYMEFDGNESHYWVWVITDENITYAGSYGGFLNITVKSFERKDYTKRWSSQMNGSIEDYNYVFQVDAVVSKVGFTYLRYSKSLRYY